MDVLPFSSIFDGCRGRSVCSEVPIEIQQGSDGGKISNDGQLELPVEQSKCVLVKAAGEPDAQAENHPDSAAMQCYSVIPQLCSQLHCTLPLYDVRPDEIAAR